MKNDVFNCFLTFIFASMDKFAIFALLIKHK
nr:MAG TPA: hypothetical protein [Caudoviricetes sp.]DAU26750.1 MAG TPA: hypothetical protein [Caudoviricetes sp.]